MALINCPDCQTEVSDKADKCPKCGYPLNVNLQTDKSIKIEEVEFTKKKHKKAMVIAAILGVVGLILLLIPSTMILGLIILAVDIVYSIIIRIRVFWDHG
jgi:uncharacterized membrane protein YvbJ